MNWVAIKAARSVLDRMEFELARKIRALAGQQWVVARDRCKIWIFGLIGRFEHRERGNRWTHCLI